MKNNFRYCDIYNLSASIFPPSLCQLIPPVPSLANKQLLLKASFLYELFLRYVCLEANLSFQRDETEGLRGMFLLLYTFIIVVIKSCILCDLWIKLDTKTLKKFVIQIL